MSSVFINEFHYNNAGTDAGEFIEIAGPAGTDLAGYSLVLYNGASSVRSPYDTLALSGVLGDDAGPGYGFAAFSFPQIQNGGPTASPCSARPTRYCSFSATRASSRPRAAPRWA